ncbi:MAG TPA: hypothetical protein DF715_14000, partial [Oceanicaulis sp.]|nr:hypothetical protein [Oceanicaulis sp.]
MAYSVNCSFANDSDLHSEIVTDIHAATETYSQQGSCMMSSPVHTLSTSVRAGLLASAAALALLPATALANDADTAQVNEASETIIVTATRTRLPNFDYPGMASVIDMEWLESQRPSDLNDLLRDTPGLEVAGV